MCRTENYQALKTCDAAVVQLNQSAISIQSTWRMWRVRKQYLAYRKTHIPLQPLLKRNYFIDKLSEVNRCLQAQVRDDSSALAKVFAEMDIAMKQSRNIFDE